MLVWFFVLFIVPRSVVSDYGRTEIERFYFKDKVTCNIARKEIKETARGVSTRFSTASLCVM